MADLRFDELHLGLLRATATVVRGVVCADERVVLQGPSGCGKSSLLRAIAGLMPPRSGSVSLGDRVLIGMPPHENGVGLVFQSGALFPHLSVLENVIFGLRFASFARDWSDSRRRERGLNFLKRAGLESLAARGVEALSGGERQRVALVRTLITEPRCLLLDEPLSAVDPARREDLQNWIKTLWAERPVPTIIVTHDEAEAGCLGTRIVRWSEDLSCVTF